MIVETLLHLLWQMYFTSTVLQQLLRLSSIGHQTVLHFTSMDTFCRTFLTCNGTIPHTSLFQLVACEALLYVDCGPAQTFVILMLCVYAESRGQFYLIDNADSDF